MEPESLPGTDRPSSIERKQSLEHVDLAIMDNTEQPSNVVLEQSSDTVIISDTAALTTAPVIEETVLDVVPPQRKDTEGGENVDEDISEEKSVSAQNSEKLELSSEATLYCRENGRSHAPLLDFGYENCPLCSQNLQQPGHTPLSEQDQDNESEASVADDKDDEVRAISSSISARIPRRWRLLDYPGTMAGTFRPRGSKARNVETITDSLRGRGRSGYFNTFGWLPSGIRGQRITPGRDPY